ncbi:MAG: D-sedoheptulose 7-phosphate isomerase [Candidatus Eisenbacteria bacterium]
MATKHDTSGPHEHEARTALGEAAESLKRVQRDCASAVAATAEVLIHCFENGGTVYFCGNGGSAADAQHLAAEFQGRYFVDRPALPAVSLTTNTSSITAIANDFGYDHVFSRQLEGLGMPGDVLVAISTSGRSESVLRAIFAARSLAMTVIGMTGGRGAEFADLCDVALVTPHLSTPRIQEGHVAMGHTVCQLVEHALFPPPAKKAAKAAPKAAAKRAKVQRPAKSTRAKAKSGTKLGAKGRRA